MTAARAIRALLWDAKYQVFDDLEDDPYLPFILLLAAVLAGFWFWHLLPNFATWDERRRLLDPMVAAGTFVSDPGFASLREGLTAGRTFGATFYLFGAALIPTFIIVVLTDQLETFSALGDGSNLEVWLTAPDWFWTVSVASVRLLNVLFAVGGVYVTYRIGTAMRDRATGCLAALLLTFTWGFLMLAHEGGEDIPALFFVLLVVYFALRYIQTGTATHFLVGCAAGGIALSLKLTAAPVVVVIAMSYLLRGHYTIAWRDALVRPQLVVTGALVGAAMVILGFPSVLVGGPDELVGRFTSASVRVSTSEGIGPDEPIWWWFLRGYLGAFGLPLFVGVVGGTLASIVHLRASTAADGTVLLLTGVGSYLVLFIPWQSFRIHHLLPTFPLLVCLLAATFTRLSERDSSLARPLVAVLLLSGGMYAVAGDLGYATQPRDEAVEWLNANATEGATLEVYPSKFTRAAIPHKMNVTSGIARAEWMHNVTDRCPEYIELTRRNILWLTESDGNSQGTRAAFIRDLIAGERYPYTVVAEFGTKPRVLDSQTSVRRRMPELLRVGLFPRTLQYGGEQDISDREQYTLILKRTGRCQSMGRSQRGSL